MRVAMKSSSLLELRDKSELDQCLREKGASLILHFWASWCKASTPMDLIFNRLCSENSSSTIRFYRVEGEEAPEISKYFSVVVVPFFIIVKDGVLVYKLDCANPTDLAQKVAKLWALLFLRRG